jgi:glucose-1-phosphate thymidylyltransferase
MIYYPLSALILAGIREVLVISTPRDLPCFQELLGDGSRLGMTFSYLAQDKPRGLADAFVLGRDFCRGDSVCLILGDNIFYGYGFTGLLKKASQLEEGALIFGYRVSNPGEYGVVEFAADGRVLSIEEKPQNPKSNYAVPGLYFYDKDVTNIAAAVKPSARGELEITDLHMEYLRRGKLKVELMGRGMAWLDTGTHRSMLDAANFIESVQTRQGLYIACLEEAAHHMGFITAGQLREQGERLQASEYGKYILRLCDGI